MTSDPNRLRALIKQLASRRVAVLGDLILDEYLVGRPTRVSREAPVLVLEFSRRFCRAGGAGNPALNILALGSTPSLVAAVGDDQAGQTLLEGLGAAGLDARGVVLRSAARTAAKTRLLAEESASRQHVARLDYPPTELDQASRQQLGDRLRAAAAEADALLLSDYRLGVIDSEAIALARELGNQYSILTLVDSQGDLLQFAGLDLVKCNQAEAERALERSLSSLSDVERAGAELLAALGSRYVVLTRGAEGLSAFERDQPPRHLPAANRTEVFDVTGAGDTVIAVLTLGLLAGASLLEAAQLANIAAGLVVRRLGVATTSLNELKAAIP
jgi:rfaE bifunctional protein kinase chain/domain